MQQKKIWCGDVLGNVLTNKDVEEDESTGDKTKKEGDVDIGDEAVAPKNSVFWFDPQVSWLLTFKVGVFIQQA